MMPAAILGSAAIGAAGQAGLFGGPKQYGYSKGDLDAIAAERSGQIADFSKQLADMRSQYMAQIPGLQAAAFQRFGGDAAAKFGANGIGVDSGAFASALAREAIPMQAQMYGTAYSTGVQNADAVNQAYGNLFQSRMGAGSAGMSAPTPNPLWASLGQFAGQAGLMSLYKGMNTSGAAPTPDGLPGYAGVPSGGANGGSVIPGYLGPSWK